jgi:hypothetical protein
MRVAYEFKSQYLRRKRMLLESWCFYNALRDVGANNYEAVNYKLIEEKTPA